ncbi:MAG: TVP38/TMEM64 family protein [Halobacteriota archaeon]
MTDDGWSVTTGAAGVRIFTSPQNRRRFIVHLVVATAIGIAVLILLWPRLSVLRDVDDLRTYIAGFSVLAPAVLVALQAAQVVIAPVPGQPLALVSGYLFGTVWGTAYSMAGITLGSALAFWLSRRLGRPYVERMIHPNLLDRFDAFGDAGLRPVLFLLFLVPGLPDDALCFIGGLSTIPLHQLILLAILGRLPAFLVVNLIGDRAWAGEWLLVGLLAVLLVLLSVAGVLYRDALLDRIEGWIR